MAEVLVTGGTGYIGSWCILALLNAGHSVRTTVRSLSREPELRAMLQRGGAPADAPLRVVPADLTKDAGWPEAVRGCDAVLHVASPTLTSTPARTRRWSPRPATASCVSCGHPATRA